MECHNMGFERCSFELCSFLTLSCQFKVTHSGYIVVDVGDELKFQIYSILWHAKTL